MAKKTVNKAHYTPRKYIRFSPDPLTVAYLALGSAAEFEPTLVAVVINEAYEGCSLLLNTDERFKKDQKIKIKVGQLPIMKAKIVWMKNLEESIHKIGVKFLD